MRGSIWHGMLECDDFRRALLADVAGTTGASWSPQVDAVPFATRRERMIDVLAEALETHADIDALLALTEANR